jgi:hypothetical protein
MGFGPDQLRDKALLALEEAVQECRYARPRPTFALRFALAYLWAYRPADRKPFDAFWRMLRAGHSPWSHARADGALAEVYRALGVPRDPALSDRMWDRRFAEERDSDRRK